jgi:hypothetical protein
MMALHELKTWPVYFEAVINGDKNFEVRKNDRSFQTGDTLLLREYDPGTGEYSGHELTFRVGYVLVGMGIEYGHCVMSLLPTPRPDEVK